MPLVERMVVVMLIGSFELALETILTGSEIGCGLWVNAALCEVELDGLVEIGIAAGVVVAGWKWECIEVERRVVVVLTSGVGVDIELVGGAMGLEEVEGGLRSSEIRYLVLHPRGKQTYQLVSAHKIESTGSSETIEGKMKSSSSISTRKVYW